MMCFCCFQHNRRAILFHKKIIDKENGAGALGASVSNACFTNDTCAVTRTCMQQILCDFDSIDQDIPKLSCCASSMWQTDLQDDHRSSLAASLKCCFVPRHMHSQWDVLENGDWCFGRRGTEASCVKVKASLKQLLCLKRITNQFKIDHAGLRQV